MSVKLSFWPGDDKILQRLLDVVITKLLQLVPGGDLVAQITRAITTACSCWSRREHDHYTFLGGHSFDDIRIASLHVEQRLANGSTGGC